MQMRRTSITSGLLAFALLAGCAHRPAPPAAAAPQPPLPPALPPPQARPPAADTRGIIPDSLPGTWLLTQAISLPNVPADGQPSDTAARGITSAMVVRITRTDAAWRVERIALPQPVLMRVLTDASAQGAGFLPGDDLTAAVAAATDQAEPMPPVGDQILLLGPDAPATGAPQLALAFLDHRSGRVQGTTYLATRVTRDRLQGRYESAGVNLSPEGTVVPLGFSGNFAMYRLR